MRSVQIDQAALDAVLAHAREARPRECCGLLIGQRDEILSAVRARNIAERATEFLIDPQDHIRARRTARQQGLEVVGFYHSHPHSAPVPSPKDLEDATYPECVYVIAGVEDGRATARAFRLNGKMFDEARVSVRASGAGLNLNRD